MTNVTNTFEQIKHFDEDGYEYWNSRELAQALEYVDYRNFESVIGSAKKACENSSQSVSDHFVDVTEMTKIAKGAEREIKTTLSEEKSVRLSRILGILCRKTYPRLRKALSS